MSAIRAVLLGAACLLCATAETVIAAESITPVQSAVREVWRINPDVQAAAADVEAARARARASAQPLYNPTLGFDVENADVNRRTASLSLALDVSGKRRARSAQGDAALQSSEASFELLRRNIASRWLKAWSASALAGKQRELGERRVALMQHFDALASQRLKVGDISSPERDLAGLALGEAQIQQASLIGNEAAARAALMAIAPASANASPVLPENLPPVSNSVTAKSVDERLELIKARAEQSAAEAGEQIARRARTPDPTISLTGGRVRAGPVYDQVIGINVSIPLPVLNTGRAEVDAARAETEAATANVRSQRLTTDASLQEAKTRYDALRTASDAFLRGRTAAFDERTALLEKLWRTGEISTSDYLVQLKQSLDTALSGLELESQAWQAWFDYLSAAGRLNDWIDGRTQDASP